MRTFSLILASAGVSFLIASCSTFQVDFADSIENAKVPPDSPLGPWQGRWKSNANGHEGPLWCIITPTPGQPQSLDFRYRAGWGKLQFGDYLHTVQVADNHKRMVPLDDEMVLPGGFGTFEVKGTVKEETFDATFQSDSGDHGTMTLRRPQ